MFGHDEDQNNMNDTGTNLPEPTADGALGGNDDSAITTPVSPPAPLADDHDDVIGNMAGNNATPPTIPAPEPAPEVDTPDTDETPPPQGPPAVSPRGMNGVAADADGHDLLAIKQEALQQLSPLVDHLDQSPEERFQTTMMMIQASDDQSLIQAAFAAAKQITDDKTRAQALLDVINEINYFTQHPTDTAAQD
jgi:hypothetical protein